jgi:hypothetical protein
MAKYRKKPVVIEAELATEEQQIVTMEGTMTAQRGDYIITGVKGERYPCKPDIFRATYEREDALNETEWSPEVEPAKAGARL